MLREWAQPVRRMLRMSGTKQKKIVKPSEKIQGVGKPQPSLNILIQELARTYPAADDWHYAELLPRHLGEFLKTGVFDKLKGTHLAEL